MTNTQKTITVVSLSLLYVDLIQRRKKDKPPVFVVDWLPGNFNAMTIPPIGIFVKRSALGNENLLKHEGVHWNQYCERGTIGFYLAYLLGSLQGYDNNPLEIEARYIEDEFIKRNYTYAVRNGLARTVYNPDFRK